ncbi:right-handed parallel beta-helix repeat-containing protein [Sorangium sp. So ce1128]
MVNMRERSIRWRLVAAVVWALVTALMLLGCGDPVDAANACAPGEVAPEDALCEPKPCGPDEVILEPGVCQPVGLPPDMPCPPGQLALEDGHCQPAGVPPEACGAGFVADGDGGCAAILPDEECPKGRMAIPGDTSCREVAPCGNGPWGDILVKPNTQYVDQAYAGGESDGTSARPWTTIQRGIDAAEGGAIVAVAAGSYVEDVVIAGKAVRLWGRCPGLVEIRGTGQQRGAVEVHRSATAGIEIRSLAITGAQVGMIIRGARDVTIEQVWVHDVVDLGIDVEDAYGPTSVALRGSLIEQNHDVGVFVAGSDATIEATVVRATQPSSDGTEGTGILVRYNLDTDERARVTVRACLVEQNHDAGVLVVGSDATIEDTVVRATHPSSGGTYGGGIVVHYDPDTGERASVAVRACLVELNRTTMRACSSLAPTRRSKTPSSAPHTPEQMGRKERASSSNTTRIQTSAQA